MWRYLRIRLDNEYLCDSCLLRQSECTCTGIPTGIRRVIDSVIEGTIECKYLNHTGSHRDEEITVVAYASRMSTRLHRITTVRLPPRLAAGNLIYQVRISPEYRLLGQSEAP